MTRKQPADQHLGKKQPIKTRPSYTLPVFIFRHNTEIGIDDALIAGNLRRSAVGNLAPVVEYRDPVGKPHHHADVMLDQDNR